MRRQINGPVNVVRLEGYVGDTFKVVYLLFDLHFDLYMQTQCRNPFARDVNKFLTETFYDLKDSSKIYDFFLEINPNDLDIYNNKRGIYLSETRKMFQKIFRQDSNNAIAKDFSNVRFHYLDIRSVLGSLTWDSYYRLEDAIRDIITSNNIQMVLKNIIPSIDDLIGICQQFLVIMKEHRTKRVKTTKQSLAKKREGSSNIRQLDPDELDSINYVVDKMVYRYHHANIKKMLEWDINDVIKRMAQILRYLLEAQEEFPKIIEELDDYSPYKLNCNEDFCGYGMTFTDRMNFVHRIVKILDNIHSKLLNFGTVFTDIYLLRRLLDKDYITNAIIYTGADHSTFYAWTLVRKLDFKITHGSYLREKNMDVLNKQIKNVKDVADIKHLFIPNPVEQCSDISEFPEIFS